MWYLVLSCLGLVKIDCPTFSEMKFEFDPFLLVCSTRATEGPLKSRRWLDSNPIIIKVDLGTKNDII